ncbi:MAG TPA: tandem-95 repeat protein [Frankiaceae bacterium]|nr:tandem-95 repeat protein [Frankiaceae bacterium]
MPAPFRSRLFVLATVALPALGVALALSVSAEAADEFAATASISNSPQYLGDTAGTAFTFTVTNTGTTTTLGAVEIERPSTGWSITSCGTAPTGWSAQKADPRCRYRSGETGADDILPGQSKQFVVTATTQPGTVNRVGTWHVVVSKSNQFDNPSLLTAADGGLQTTAYTWEVLDAVVSDAAVATGSACPASDKDELTGSTVTMVICGRNHATVPLTPAAGFSSLSGTFLAESGVFSSGQIAANSAPVVVANWTDAKVRNTPGQNLTVVATIGSAGNQTSPVTTLNGYEAINAPPVANDDEYSVAEDGSLSEPAPGVLDNDTDPEGQPMTAVLVDGPDHAASFTLNADGSFDYAPAADYAGSDSFTYDAHDGIQASSSPATVSITVTAVNDAPVNTAPASVSTEEETAYVFAPGALSVADADSGAADVETTLAVPNASVTVGTSGVTVTGNGTDDVTVTGPVTAVAAALDGATLTPDPGFSGTTTLTMTTSDLGNTGSGGALTDTDAISVSVLFVNDAPSFTPGADQTVAEDSGAQSVAGWATAISKGGASESGQTLDFQVTNDYAALFQAAPAVSPSGTLTYEPADDAYGTANVTVVLHDDGGTANGGDDTSDAETFTITVTPVNDAPSAANQTATAQANMRVRVTGLLAGASDTADAGGAYTPAFTLDTVTPASCAGCVVTDISPDGSFDLDTPAGATGTFTLNYTIKDTGHPAPGVASAPATITVTVQGPVIWFVDGAVPGPGTGTMSDPFKTLSAASAAAGAGEKIFVSSGTVTGSLSQAANGWLVGQGVTGASFDAVMGVTPPAGTAPRPAINGTRPTIVGGVSLSDGSVVRGLNLTPPSGTPGLLSLADDALTIGEVSVTSVNARAVDIVSSQGSTISLTSVSSTSAPNGIRLSSVNTTTPGSVSVTGGSTAGSGGTISGSTGAGVALANVDGVSLAWMTVSGSAAEGIAGTAVKGLSVTDSTISGSGVHGVSLANPSGSSALTRVTVHGSANDNARVFGSSGTSSLTVTDSTFRDNSTTTGGNGLLVQADGSAAMTVTATGSSYLRNRSIGLAVRANSSAKTTSTLTGGTYDTNGTGIDIVSSATGGHAFALSGGTVTGCATCGTPVNVYKATGGTGTGASALAGSVSGMTVTNGNSENSSGIWVHAEGAGATRVAITNNNVSQIAEQGILVAAGNGSSSMDATITGNTVTLLDPLALQGIQVDSGTLTGDTTAVCADIKTNTVVSVAAADVRVRNLRAGTTFRLPGYAGGATSTTDVVTFLILQNTITDAAAVVGSSPGFAGGAACAAP